MITPWSQTVWNVLEAISYRFETTREAFPFAVTHFLFTSLS